MKKIIFLSLSLSLNLFALESRSFDAVAECHRCHRNFGFRAVEIWNEWNKSWELKTSGIWVPEHCELCKTEIANKPEIQCRWLLPYCHSYIVGAGHGDEHDKSHTTRSILPHSSPRHLNKRFAQQKHGIQPGGCGVYDCHGEKCKQF